MSKEILKHKICPILLALSIFLFSESSGKSFKDSPIAVQFTVYEHHSYNETLEDVQEKMKLVSSQFKRVFSFGIMAREDDSNYRIDEIYDQSFPQAYAAEAAALVNSEVPNSLKVYIGIYPHSNEHQFRKELNIAIDSARKSELERPYTVQGFVIDFKDVPLQTEVINEVVEMIDSSSQFRNLTLGLRLNCDTILKEKTHLSVIFDHIHKQFFLICVQYPITNFQGKQAFTQVATKFQNVNETLRAEHSNVIVFGQTGFLAGGHGEELRNFWEAAEKWAKNKDFPIVMTEAFDNPSKIWDDTLKHKGHYGWWDASMNETTKKFNVFKTKISATIVPVMKGNTSSTNAKGGVGLTSTDTSFKYNIVIMGMILIKFII